MQVDKAHEVARLSKNFFYDNSIDPWNMQVTSRQNKWGKSFIFIEKIAKCLKNWNGTTIDVQISETVLKKTV